MTSSKLAIESVFRFRMAFLFLLLLFLAPAVTASASGLALGSTAPHTPLEIYRLSLAPHANYAATLRVETPAGSAEIKILRYEGITRYTISTPSGEATIVSGTDRNGVERRAGYGAVPKGFFSSVGRGIPQDLELLAANYSIEQRGSSAAMRVAGRPTVALSITPKRDGNPSRLVWLDAETYVQLRLEDYDYRGRLIQRRELADIQFGVTLSRSEADALRQALFGPGKQAGQNDRPGLAGPGADHPGPSPLLPVAEASKKVGFSIELPAYLPPGYRLAGVRIPRREGGAAHVLYTDGLGVISLYEKKVPWWARKSRDPGVPDQTGLFEWEKDGIHFTLLGDNSPEELGRMAASVGKNAK